MKAIVLAVCILASSVGATAQRWQQAEVGFTVSISFINEKMPEGYYQPILFKGLWAWHLGKTENLDGKRGHFLGYMEPQINPVFVSGRLIDLEFGWNFGLRYSYDLNQANKLYAAIGTGPHYTTVNTTKQARGFLFSDNFIFGWNRQLHGPIYSNVQYHFRHISNANLMKPNQGLDNHFLTLGVSRLLY